MIQRAGLDDDAAGRARINIADRPLQHERPKPLADSVCDKTDKHNLNLRKQLEIKLHKTDCPVKAFEREYLRRGVVNNG